jgi:hypothetical protein
MRDDLALFFGTDPAQPSRVQRERGRMLCWPGLLFPPAWFLYCRMYRWAALVTAGPFVLERLPYLGWLSWGASVLGAFGAWLYFRSAERIVATIRAESADDDEACERIALAGRVSWFGAAVGLLFSFAAYIAALKAGAP